MGCLDKPRHAASGGSAIGSWQLTNVNGCAQHLTLTADGEFALESWLSAGSKFEVGQLVGTLSTAGSEMRGQFATRFLPNVAPGGQSPVYCTDWSPSPPTSLPFTAVYSALGVDPLDLVYFPSIHPELGLVLAGADASRRDRLVFYRRSTGAMAAIQVDDATNFPMGIFRAMPGDAEPEYDQFSGRKLIRVPGEIFKTTHLNAVALQNLDKVLLALTAGVDITFSGFSNSTNSACSFTLYEDALLTTPIVTNQLAPFVSSQTRTFNPAEPGWPYATTTIGSTTVFIVPVVTSSPVDGNCDALIRATPISTRVATDHDSTPGTDALFTVGLPDGIAYLSGSRPGFPQKLDRIQFTGGNVPFGPLSLNGSLAVAANTPSSQQSRSSYDPLHLKSGNPATAILSVASPSTRALNIFPAADSRFGWGPFLPFASSTTKELTIPETRSLTASSDGQRTAFNLTILSGQRIAIWTDGGVATTGHLMDSAGRTIHLSAGGAADHAGFRIEADLVPGNYILSVTASAGTFTVSTAILTTTASFADAALDACMIEAGWALTPGEVVTSARCVGKGVQSIDDIGLASNLEHLDLGRNAISDIGALQNLLLLRTLSVAGNPATDLSALIGLSRLRMLSLAETPIATETFPVLQTMADQLALLDLTGVKTLSDDDLNTLRAILPATTIIAPNGTVLP